MTRSSRPSAIRPARLGTSSGSNVPARSWGPQQTGRHQAAARRSLAAFEPKLAFGQAVVYGRCLR